MNTLSIPSSGAYIFENARLHASLTVGLNGAADADGFASADIAIDDGRIVTIAPHRLGASPAPEVIDLKGRIILPCFVDCHTHLDKGHIWPRSPNPDGSFAGALRATNTDRAVRWNTEDVSRRMDFALRTACAHGTKAIRTHLDSAAPQDAISWPVFEEMREKWQGRIELQAACLVGIEETRDQVWFAGLARRVAEARGVLGAVTYMVPDLESLLDRMFSLAIEHDLDLDFHADETDNVDAVSLKKIADMTRGRYFHATTGEDLKQIYGNLGKQLVVETKEMEITAFFAAAAALLMMLAATLSLFWFGRLA